MGMSVIHPNQFYGHDACGLGVPLLRG